MELAVRVSGISLEHPLMNAAGTVKTLEDVDRIVFSATAAVMVGSITFNERGGNSGNVYWSSPDFSLNSLGLPNRGAEYYKKNLPEMVSRAHDAGKPIFISVAGFTRMEYAVLAELALLGGADLVELNLACPNVWDGKNQKGIICFHPEEVAELLQTISPYVHGASISAKLSPISDPFQLRRVANAIAESNCVQIVTAVNCFPNAIAFDDSGRPRTDPGGGLAGLGGPPLKPIGLGQVKQLHDILPEHIEIIGVGGISSGKDIVDYQRAGAIAVQINTAYTDEREPVFSRILGEYIE